MRTTILKLLSLFMLNNIAMPTASYPESWIPSSNRIEVFDINFTSLQFYFSIIAANKNSLILKFSQTAAPFLIYEDPFNKKNQKHRHTLPGEMVAFPLGQALVLNHRDNGVTFEPLPSPFEKRGFF